MGNTKNIVTTVVIASVSGAIISTSGSISGATSYSNNENYSASTMSVQADDGDPYLNHNYGYQDDGSYIFDPAYADSDDQPNLGIATLNASFKIPDNLGPSSDSHSTLYTENTPDKGYTDPYTTDYGGYVNGSWVEYSEMDITTPGEQFIYNPLYQGEITPDGSIKVYDGEMTDSDNNYTPNTNNNTNNNSSNNKNDDTNKNVSNNTTNNNVNNEVTNTANTINNIQGSMTIYYTTKENTSEITKLTGITIPTLPSVKDNTNIYMYLSSSKDSVFLDTKYNDSQIIDKINKDTNKLNLDVSNSSEQARKNNIYKINGNNKTTLLKTNTNENFFKLNTYVYMHLITENNDVYVCKIRINKVSIFEMY